MPPLGSQPAGAAPLSTRAAEALGLLSTFPKPASFAESIQSPNRLRRPGPLFSSPPACPPLPAFFKRPATHRQPSRAARRAHSITRSPPYGAREHRRSRAPRPLHCTIADGRARPSTRGRAAPAPACRLPRVAQAHGACHRRPRGDPTWSTDDRCAAAAARPRRLTVSLVFTLIGCVGTPPAESLLLGPRPRGDCAGRGATPGGAGPARARRALPRHVPYA